MVAAVRRDAPGWRRQLRCASIYGTAMAGLPGTGAQLGMAGAVHSEHTGAELQIVLIQN